MAAKKNPFKNVRLVFQRSSTLVKTLVIAVLVVCTITLLALGIGISRSRANKERERQKAVALQQENDQLSEDIDKLGTIESIKDLAERFWKLVDPDSIVFSPEE